MSNYLVTAFYHFAKNEQYVQLQKPILEFCQKQHLKGTILLATEGINGTIAGNKESVALFHDYIKNDGLFNGL